MGMYFNTANYFSSESEEDSDFENEESDRVKTEKERKKTFIEDA